MGARLPLGIRVPSRMPFSGRSASTTLVRFTTTAAEGGTGAAAGAAGLVEAGIEDAGVLPLLSVFIFTAAPVGTAVSGIPVRIYREEELLFYSSVVSLPKDPMLLFQKELTPKQTQAQKGRLPLVEIFLMLNDAIFTSNAPLTMKTIVRLIMNYLSIDIFQSHITLTINYP